MRSHLAIIFIVLLAAILRLVALGSNPPGLYWDEVSLGYNAYSILKTGHDEHNRFLPIDTFKAFGDYKPPGYIYATVPSIALFGLNNFATRSPSVVAGTLLILITYFLVKELFPNVILSASAGSKKRFFGFWPQNDNNAIALLAALLLAISPWSLQLSRVAFESNLATLFNATAVLFFLKSRQKPWMIIISAICFVAAIYTFNANRVLSMIMVILLTMVYFKDLWKHKQQSIIAAGIGILLVLPIIPHLHSPEGKLRWNEVNIFSNLDVVIEANKQIAADGGGIVAKIIHHRNLGHLRNFLHHYTDHFNGRYLFLKGDINPRFSVQDIGELYLIELPFLLVGFYYLLIKHPSKQTAVSLVGWFLLAPIPAAMARETPHALRSLSVLPTPHIIIALGIGYLFSIIKKCRKILFLVACSLWLISFAYFQFVYYHYYPHEYASEWLTSYPPLVQYLRESPEAQTAKTITVVPDLGRPYIYFLFYNHYPPDKYANEVDRTGDAFGFFDVHGFDKYRFERVDPQQIKTGDIYVVRSKEELASFKKLTTIYESNGEPQFNILLKQ